jgi:hypothetical protein
MVEAGIFTYCNCNVFPQFSGPETCRNVRKVCEVYMHMFIIFSSKISRHLKGAQTKAVWLSFFYDLGPLRPLPQREKKMCSRVSQVLKLVVR